MARGRGNKWLVNDKDRRDDFSRSAIGYCMTKTGVPTSSHATPPARTWSRVARLLEDHPEVKQVRLETDVHGVTVGFYEPPSPEILERIKSAVRQELAGQWDVSIEPDGASPVLHLHKIGIHTTEVHRAHPANEPPVIWKPIRLPAWRNRPVPPPVVQ